MIEKLIEFALRHRLLVVAGVLALILTGVWSVLHLPVDSFPDVSNVQVQIITEPETMPTEEVELLVTFPIENALNGLPNIKTVRSNSSYGLSVVSAIFEDGTDVYWARQLVQQRLSHVALPPDSPEPTLGPVISTFSNVLNYYVTSDKRSMTELRTIQDWDIALRLRAVPGVASVLSFGGFEKEYQVLVNPTLLKAYGLTVKQVADAIEANNENAGGKFIERGGEEIIIRGIGRIRNEQDIQDIVLKSSNGTPVRVQQVASVTIGTAFRRGAASLNGKGEQVTGFVNIRKGANSKEVVERVIKRIDEIQADLPEDVKIVIYYDQSNLVDRTIHTVEEVLMIGSSLVVTVLFAMLLNIRGALIVSAIIPLSLLFSFTLMRQSGLTANMMTLGAVDFGVIVDAGVVMVENAYRHLAEAWKREGTVSPVKVLTSSAIEVGRPTVFAISIIIAVFIPLFALEDVEGRMFRPLALTYIYALIGALVVSLTVIPVLCSFVLRGRITERPNKALNTIHRWLSPVLDKTINHPVKTTLVSVLLLCASLCLVPFLGSEFVPSLDEGSILLRVKQAPSVSLTESTRVTTQLEKLLCKFPEVAIVVTRTGRSGAGADLEGVDNADIYIGLKPKKEWKRSKAELIQSMDQQMAQIPGLIYSFSQPIADMIDDLVAGIRADVGIKIFGKDPALLDAIAQEIEKTAAKVSGTTDLQRENILGLPQLNIEFDRSNLARFHLNIDDVQEIIKIAIAGKVVTEVVESPKRFGLLVRFPADYRNNIDKLQAIIVDAPGGEHVPLGQLAHFSLQRGLVMINRENGERRTAVLCNVRSRDLGSYVHDLQGMVKQQVQIPKGYRIVWGGQFENQERAMSRLSLVVPVVLVFIFLLLYGSFGSLRNALLVMMNVPFALIGGIVALFLTHLVVSVPAVIGFIALFGVAVQNGVIMVSHIMHLQKEGQGFADAAKHGAEVRLRPVLMTALVAIVGFAPLLLSSGTGAEVQRPLAVVVTGGLLTATPLTLLVLPALYVLINKVGANRTEKEKQL